MRGRRQVAGRPRVSYAKAVFGRKELAAVRKVLSTPMIVAGPQVARFEARIAPLFAKRHGVMTNSGSSANLTALTVLDLPERSEVITPVLTFGTTLAPIVQKRLVPAFVDVEPGTYQINVDHVERMITKRTSALLVPSLIGNVPDYPRLRQIADKHRLYLIEDSCDTLGATLDGKSTGTYSDLSTTSFYGSHVITAGGSGGMLCLDRDEWYERARTLVGWGRSSARNESEDPAQRFDVELHGVPYDNKFVFEEVGYNFLSTDVNAAFGLAQLDRLETFSRRRQVLFEKLQDFFRPYQDLFVLPRQHPRSRTAWLAFPLTITPDAPFTRVELVRYLEERNIQTRPIFTGNAIRQPAFRSITRKTAPGGYPVADEIMQRAFMVGCHHGMTAPELRHLQETFTGFLGRHTKRSAA